MNSARDDLVELSDHAWQRLRRRMEGLSDPEYLWVPVPDMRAFTTLAWRLGHIAHMLAENRNGPWLGRPAAPVPEGGDPRTAADALSALERAYEAWSETLAGTTDASLAEPIGAVAGRYGGATRRSFVLHVIDELVHHGAEAAMLRDLYAATRSR